MQGVPVRQVTIIEINITVNTIKWNITTLYYTGDNIQ